jgi:hypothetical protein
VAASTIILDQLSAVDTGRQQGHTHCLWEMILHGWAEADVAARREELHGQAAELDAMTEEERDQELIPFEQVLEELEAKRNRPM